VKQSGGDEVGGLEDLEIALGGVVAFGALDDGLGGGVPGDFLEGEGMAGPAFRQLKRSRPSSPGSIGPRGGGRGVRPDQAGWPYPGVIENKIPVI
jgi:hypothetical protein